MRCEEVKINLFTNVVLQLPLCMPILECIYIPVGVLRLVGSTPEWLDLSLESLPEIVNSHFIKLSNFVKKRKRKINN